VAIDSQVWVSTLDQNEQRKSGRQVVRRIFPDNSSGHLHAIVRVS